jgi:SET domain-containing protein
MIDVEVRPSAVEGLGLFALHRCHAGERIREVNVVREITAEAPLRPELGERIEHCDYPDGKVVLIGPPDRHVNHSCDPNTYILYEEGRCFIVARRDIAAGDELTCDYNMNITGGDAWECRCGAARCRGSTTGDFFLLPEAIQHEYRPLLAGWFVRTHRERLEELDRRLGHGQDGG